MSKKRQRILTLAQLVKFCEERKIYSFDSKDSGYELSVQVPGAYLSFEEETAKGILFCKVKVCHTLLNRNGSYISEENMKKAMPSLQQYRPLLARIHQLDDGSYDFHSHDMEINTDGNGEEVIEYIEKQIGTFTIDEPYLEYDEEKDKTYVIARVAIPEEYTKAAEIIKAKNGTKVSCELVIYSLSYNAKERYLELEDFYFAGCTCLGSEKDGTEIGEGMLGARLDIEDFSVSNNSVCRNVQTQQFNEDLIKRVANLEDKLASFNIQTSFEEGGTGVKLKELLEKYGKTSEELNFETEGLSDEELEAKFAEAFDEGNSKNNPESKDEVTSKYSIFVDGKEVHSFEISHEDIRYSLNQLISIYDEQDDDWYFCEQVFDDHFVFSGWSIDNVWGQKYSVNDNNVSLEGERWRLYRELVTESEMAELKAMRENYSAIQKELNAYKEKELDIERSKVFNDESYKPYLEKEVFKELIANKNKYTVDELRDQAEIAFAKCVKEAGSFNLEQTNNEKKARRTFSNPKTEKSKSPYGNIFNRNK